MKYIELTQDKRAIVDDEDFEWLNKWNWYAAEQVSGVFYACRVPWRKRGSSRHTLFMHKEILKPSSGKLTDHRNGDGLDNRRANLRECTPQQNGANKRKQSSPTASQYKGVGLYKYRRKKKWCARIKFLGRLIHLGTFEREEGAAMAYNNKAKEVFGEFAELNVIERNNHAN